MTLRLKTPNSRLSLSNIWQTLSTSLIRTVPTRLNFSLTSSRLSAPTRLMPTCGLHAKHSSRLALGGRRARLSFLALLVISASTRTSTLGGLLVALKNDAQIAAMDSEDGDAYAGNKLGAELLGFHGIEYIIFKDGAAKPASEITDKDLVYAIAVAGDLRNKCYQLQVSWAGADACPKNRVAKLEELEWNTTTTGGFSYNENMLNSGKAGSTYVTWTAAMQQIIDGCMDISDEVGTSKIGKPHTGEDKNYIESPYSENSITDFYDNILSIQNSYMGGIEGKRDEAKSLHAYVKSVNADLDSKVVAAINNALAKIKGMKAPFVKNYTDASCQEAMDACDALNKVLATVKEELAK